MQAVKKGEQLRKVVKSKVATKNGRDGRLMDKNFITTVQVNILCILCVYNMYHFHTSDQRVKPVHISYIALVLEC